MMIYSYNPLRFSRNMPGEDVRRWLTLHRLINANVSFVDRTGHISLPIRTAVAPQLAMPDYDPGFGMTYSECAHHRVRELIARQDKLGVPIRLYYSGGIDSSFILVSFINELGQAEAEKRVQIVMSMDSIEENPWMWERLLRRSRFTIIPSEIHSSDWGTDRITVGGEFNDQLLGSDIYKDMVVWKGEKILDTPWTEDLMTEYHQRKGLSRNDAEMWTGVFASMVRSAPCPVDTAADWWWWINFSCKWSSVYFRLLMFARDTRKISQSYLDNYYCQFYGSENFQKWSMKDREHKHQGTIMSYKWLPRKLVADFMMEPSYNQKIKRGSLWALLSYRKGADLITENYEAVHGINPMDWYQADNSFASPRRDLAKTGATT